MLFSFRNVQGIFGDKIGFSMRERHREHTDSKSPAGHFVFFFKRAYSLRFKDLVDFTGVASGRMVLQGAETWFSPEKWRLFGMRVELPVAVDHLAVRGDNR